jgi:hypothetical protein
MNALELINTKEILNKEEFEIVKKYDEEYHEELVWKYLNYIGEGRWLNVNVYSEHEHHEHVLRMEQGY